MKRFFVVLAVLLAFKGFSYDEYLFYPQGQFKFISYQYGPYLLNGFSFESAIIYGVEKNQQKVRIGTIEKLKELTRAYAYKVGDSVVSTHHAYFLSSGSLFDRLKTYDIYDENNHLLGFIEGVWDKNTSACFFFYKANYEFFAKAVLDLSTYRLTISTPDDEILATGEKTLRASWYASPHYPNEYSWKIKMKREEPLSGSFLWPFMGFLSEVWCK